VKLTVEIDDSLWQSLKIYTGARTRREAVERALREYVRLRLKDELINSRGKIHVDDTWKKLRELDKLELNRLDRLWSKSRRKPKV